jgi:tRNA threonylcarbamoyladenosine biosynthesis protein TsaE
MTDIIVHDLADLPSASEKLLHEIENANVVALYGAMGAGKTTLIKALCKTMKVEETVSSPTFSLVNEYHTEDNRIIYHFDFYRINRIEEAYDLGYEEYFYSGNLCFVEWPELIEELLPDNTIKIRMNVQPDGSRIISLEA